MDQFIVSARKYRPDTFNSVVGQSHITETLKNAIKSNHLAQAFLFSGPRGVGKTTCARILAKTVNCFNRSEKIEACDECESCKSFNDGHSLNIYELDAASNNGVDDIRQLIDQVRFAPQIGSKKVYIIDEVHMLSPSAFNAFLKTLEEPPSHAMFILATTERHKIIPTVLSRCQIFDFNRINPEDMVRSLEKIAKSEDVKTEYDALHLIAQKSDGSLRDALSMFDQMVTFSGGNLTYTSVVENLSILSTDYFFDLTNHLVKHDVASSLNLFNEVLHKGFEGHHFLLGLAEHMRNLLVAQDHDTIKLLTVGPQIKEKYTHQTLEVSTPFLIKALNLISQADLNYKSARNQRLLVELCLINIGNLSASDEKNKPSSPASISTKPEIKKKSIEVKSDPSSGEKTSVSVKNNPEVDLPAKRDLPKKEYPLSDEKPIVVKEEKADLPKTGAPEEEKIESKNLNPDTEVVKEDNSNAKIPAPEVKPQIQKPDLSQEEKGKTKSKRGFHDEIITDSISINSFTSVSEEEINVKEESLREIKYREAVSEEKLSESWKKLLHDFNSKGRMMLYATLAKYKPKVIDDNHIEITYDNKSQAEAIRKEKTDILERLREDLKNDLLQLKLITSNQKHQRAYTDSEKLEKMIEKNPNINLLKDKLDLDLS